MTLVARSDKKRFLSAFSFFSVVFSLEVEEGHFCFQKHCLHHGKNLVFSLSCYCSSPCCEKKKATTTTK